VAAGVAVGPQKAVSEDHAPEVGAKIPPWGSPWDLDVTFIPGRRAETQPELPIPFSVPADSINSQSNSG
jgi:hypothetical protein